MCAMDDSDMVSSQFRRILRSFNLAAGVYEAINKPGRCSPYSRLSGSRPRRIKYTPQVLFLGPFHFILQSTFTQFSSHLSLIPCTVHLSYLLSHTIAYSRHFIQSFSTTSTRSHLHSITRHGTSPSSRRGGYSLFNLLVLFICRVFCTRCPRSSVKDINNKDTTEIHH